MIAQPSEVAFTLADVAGDVVGIVTTLHGVAGAVVCVAPTQDVAGRPGPTGVADANAIAEVRVVAAPIACADNACGHRAVDLATGAGESGEARAVNGCAAERIRLVGALAAR